MPVAEKLSAFNADPGKPPGNWLVRFQEVAHGKLTPKDRGLRLKAIFDDIRDYYREFYKAIALDMAHDEALRKVMNEIQILRIEVANLKQGEVS